MGPVARKYSTIEVHGE